MKDTLVDCVSTVRTTKKHRSLGKSVLLILSLLVFANVLISLRQVGLTLAGDADCGYEAHTHSEECYDENGMLICEKTEHEHTTECYSDEDADVETQLYWHNMVLGLVSDDLRSDFVNVARSQIGYTESTANFKVDSDLVRRGYTRYGAWYGAPYSDWSAMFVSFCLNFAGSAATDNPYNIGADAMAQEWNNKGKYIAAGSTQKPEAGDLVFYNDNTVGVITGITSDTLTVVQGDVDNAVSEYTISLDNETISGYGILTSDTDTITIYLDQTNGSDSASGTKAQPVQTMQKAFALLPEGGTICIVGTYKYEFTGSAPNNNYLIKLPETNGKVTITSADKQNPSILLFETGTKTTVQPLSPVEFNNLIWQYDHKGHNGKIGNMNIYTGPELVFGKNMVFECINDECNSNPKHENCIAIRGGWHTPESKGTIYTGDDIVITVMSGKFAYINGGNADGNTPVGNSIITIGGTTEIYQFLQAAGSNGGDVTGNVTINITGGKIATGGSATDTSNYGLVLIGHGKESNYSEIEGNLTVNISGGYIRRIKANRTAYEKMKGNLTLNISGNPTIGTTHVNPYHFDTSKKHTLILTEGADASKYPEASLWDSIEYTPITEEDTSASSSQIDNVGGATESEFGDGVLVSKTIAGTNIENVFDITLNVQTQESISSIYEEPDMAIVIVMDISNTMRHGFGDTTRYLAAMEAADQFIDNFASNSGGVSRIGYVAFNTSAHEIFPLSSCSNETEATALKNKMRSATGAIINAEGYNESHTRFTNIEAGLKMGADMIAEATNENKYIIFLSDGFPTTYIDTGYTGYDPYTPDSQPGVKGEFYDAVRDIHCSEGASYSDTAAIKARKIATVIKETGTKIFTIGVGVGGQTIQKYIGIGYTGFNDDGTPIWNNFSVVECGDGTWQVKGDKVVYNYKFEIGDAEDSNSYINWLKNSIGSGYYYDSTDSQGLQYAYDEIFKEILRLKEEASKADWVAQDPLPLTPPGHIEFVGFYDIYGSLVSSDTNLSGEAGWANENTAVFEYNDSTKLNTISWDLKKSGYATTTDNDVTTYTYQLVYRVRLKNETIGFDENTIYDTNAPTSLTYRVFESVDGVTTISDQRSVDFKIPAVRGYLANLEFNKVDSHNRPLEGAEFILYHYVTSCPICSGYDENHVVFTNYTAISSADGIVLFENIPSGHKYILQEIKAPNGYIGDYLPRSVEVAYDVITWEDGWTGEIVNKDAREFPATGSHGTLLYILSGALLIIAPVVYGYIRQHNRERRGEV